MSPVAPLLVAPCMTRVSLTRVSRLHARRLNVTLDAPPGVQPTPTEVRYAYEAFPQCALYSGADGDYSSLDALPAPPFRVAVGACDTGAQVSCALGDARTGADPGESQCCDTSYEACVPSGGCQRSFP